MVINYKPRNVCSQQITIEVNDGIVNEVKFIGGCGGNAKGISSLVKGMKIDDVIKKLENIDCGGRGTSCPAQLVSALKELV